MVTKDLFISVHAAVVADVSARPLKTPRSWSKNTPLRVLFSTPVRKNGQTRSPELLKSCILGILLILEQYIYRGALNVIF